MTVIKNAICWAVAMLAIAVAKRMGLIEPKTGELLLLVLPIVAVTTMFRNERRCGPERRA